MVINELRNYIKTCPYLEIFNNAIGAKETDLDSNIDIYPMEEVPIESILKKYVNDDSVRKYDFIFTSKEPYGADVLQNINNSGFYEKFTQWIENQNDNEIFPALGNKLEPLEVKVNSTSYTLEVSEGMSKFQIQLRLKYLKKRGID